MDTEFSDQVTISLEINRALVNKDMDTCLKLLAKMMVEQNLSVTPETLRMIPVSESDRLVIVQGS